ncbi:class I adenylate-forming enzyme family protein [Cryobacterium sp. TMT1-66-1]|uniref:class I adenylate-forming enzyme family protein n=1 Tax=Cryobacterium sp. TMT1-66-1 TaxID=1259242 RepID=UPI00106ACAF5|nr:class I adenylate-forming enzyme family protein [Cryobacterium sp. TMT1-66-1]TFD06323.1 long-chain fatty acid--CoA ligase [Cryobacterium sp. TMT1-66-1]
MWVHKGGILPPKNIGLLFDWHANKSKTTELHLDRPFDIAPNGGVTYDAAMLAALVREASGWLFEAGVRRGDRVAVVKQNHFDMIVLAAASARIGAIAATISSLNRPEDLKELLHKLQPDLTIMSSATLAEGQVQGLDLAERGKALLLENERDVGTARTILLDDLRGSSIPETDIRHEGEPMIITHTSGTTSAPKLVVHTAESSRAGTRLEFLPLPYAVNRRQDIALSSISFAHSRAFAWATAQLRWAPKRLVVASSHNVDDVERVIETHRPTTIEAIPNVFQHWISLVKRRPELFSQVRYYMNTFDMMHPSIVRPYLEASNRRVALWGHSWGQSEVGPIAGGVYSRAKITERVGSADDNMNTMGWAWPGLVSAKVVDPDTGRRLRRGETGILLVKSKSLCVDYLGETDRYDAKRSGTWWNTGDVGYKDRIGRIRFVDRAVDTIQGGSATELESVLLERVPGAVEIILLARGDQEPLPVVCISGELSADAWASATSGLPGMADPVIMPWENLPRTSTWKIRRKELRQMIFDGIDDDTVLEERFT